IPFLAYSTRYSNYIPIPQFSSPFTDSLPIPFLAYSLSSCNRYSGVGALNSHSIPCYSLIRLTNNSGKRGNLFLPSSSFILSDVSLPLIVEV
ncbi:hypothetical protein Gotur_010118, partial [Gossypium turneri]